MHSDGEDWKRQLAGCFDRLFILGYCHESLVKLLLLFDSFQDTQFAEPVANQN